MLAEALLPNWIFRETFDCLTLTKFCSLSSWVMLTELDCSVSLETEPFPTLPW